MIPYYDTAKFQKASQASLHGLINGVTESELFQVFVENTVWFFLFDVAF